MRFILSGLALIGIMVVKAVLALVRLVVNVVKYAVGLLGMFSMAPMVLGCIAMLAVAGHAIFSWFFLGHWPSVYTLADFSHDHARWLPQMLVSTIMDSSVIFYLLDVVILLGVMAYCLVIGAIWLGRLGDVLAHGALVLDEDKRNLRWRAKPVEVEIERNTVSSDLDEVKFRKVEM